VLFGKLLGAEEADLFFDTILHLGTLAAVVVVFWRDILDLILSVLRAPTRLKNGLPALYREDVNFRLAMLIVLGTIPAVIIGLTLEDTFERLFNSTLAVGIALCITGVVLFSTRFAPKPKKDGEKMNALDTILVGLAQAAAITPGISRSGSTISAALWLGIDRELAGRFSFLLSIPAILGAVVLQFELPSNWPPGYAATLAVGFVSSALIGVGALKLLLGLVKGGKFFYFGFYCIPVGIGAVIVSAL
jgi:undecaprenyl-diphosphatase